MALIFAAFVVLFMLLAALVGTGLTRDIDVAILTFIHDNAHFGFDTFFSFITNLGDPLILLPFGLIVSGLLLRSNRALQALVIATMIVGSGLITTTLKTIFDRARPELWQHNTVELSFSFPSGHASTSFIIATALLYLFWSSARHRLLVAALILYVTLVGLSRMYLGVHYPTDIIGGWLVAGGWAALVLFFTNRISARPRIGK